MSDELVRRLRSAKNCPDGGTCLRDYLCEDAADEIERLSKDAERLAYLYSGEQTSSDALSTIAIRITDGDMPTLDEARAAIDECMRVRRF